MVAEVIITTEAVTEETTIGEETTAISITDPITQAEGTLVEGGTTEDDLYQLIVIIWIPK